MSGECRPEASPGTTTEVSVNGSKGDTHGSVFDIWERTCCKYKYINISDILQNKTKRYWIIYTRAATSHECQGAPNSQFVQINRNSKPPHYWYYQYKGQYLTRQTFSISWHHDVKRFPHDDGIKWKHFPPCWPFVKRIHRSPVDSPHKGRWRGTLMFSLIRAWINGWVNNRKPGDLRRHRTHYDVTAMVPLLGNINLGYCTHLGPLLPMWYYFL